MPQLLARANRAASPGNPLVEVTPASAGWTYVGFAVHRLQEQDHLAVDATGKEIAVIALEGQCDVAVDGVRFADVGGRASVFDDAPPEAVYAPPGSQVMVQAQGRCEIAVASAVSDQGQGPARRIGAADIAREVRGDGSTTRYIHHILDGQHPAHKLLLVEVVTPPGNWSSFPPHKHDAEIPGQEAYLEETYYFRMQPGHGQAMERVYTADGLDEVLVPGDGDVVLVPRGYHMVASPPGFTTYYLNVMAGHNRAWRYTIDPAYAHIAPPDGNIMGKLQPSAR